MADGFDPLDDLFGDAPVKSARAGGMFRPKVKVQPRRKVTAKSSVSSIQTIQNVHSAQHVLSEPIETGKLLESISDVPNHNDKADLHAFDGKLAEENADVLIGSEAIADCFPLTNTECNNPLSSSIDDSAATFKADVPKDPCSSAEVVVSSADVCNDKDNRQGTEEIDVMDSVNTTELTTESGQRTNFQPKLKECETSGSTSYSLGLHSGLIQPDSEQRDLSATSLHDDAVDLSSLFTHTLTTESTPELLLNEESLNLLEVPQLDSCTHMEGLPELPAKLASRRANTRNCKNNDTSDPHTQQQKASISSKENEAGRSLRKGEINISELVDEDGDEIITTVEFGEEHPFNLTIDEEIMNSEQPQAENGSQKKNLKRKSKKTENDKEKPPRKSKKANEALEEDTRAKKKKFSHSTRRRRVDKKLLNIPEDEFDPSSVSLRDLILLAEHRERQMKTENAAAGAPETQNSAGNSAGLYNNVEANNFGADEDDDEDPFAEDVDTTEYFNYQSRMVKTPRVRWSKQDTELFYEAVKQFGTDFSMITRLFPGRSREQIRNKYKKEERQQPLMLREALTTRSKDHSYFERVIEDFKQIRAKEDLEDSSNEGADEGASNADDDNANEEHVEGGENGGVANDFREARSSPVKAEAEKQEEEVEAELEVEEEDDMFLWDQYKSDI